MRANSGLPPYAYVILAAGWLVWMTPFVLARRSPQPAQKVDRRARWGILLVAMGYAIVWQGHFWEGPLPLWRLVLSILFFTLAGLLSWSGTRFLGRQWRIDAGLNADHELVMSGPYRVIRHPIYASMLCLFCGTAFMLSPPPLFLLGLLFFICGTEIRVRVEDSLLASRFGDQFRSYQRSVPAYIPFLR
jgi:protein-S-isoprenylcysteine O-methyltransferase Ste14